MNMYRYKKTSWSNRPCETTTYPIEPLLKMVDEGRASLKAGCGLDDLIIQITPKSGDYYYRDRFDMTWEQFNEKYGRPYISKWNFYL